MEALVLGMVAGYGIAIPVGAIAVLIVQTGVRSGFASAASAGAGAATADLVYATVAVTAGTTLAAPLAAIEEPLQWASAAVLVVIAVVGLRRIGNDAAASSGPPAAVRAAYAGTYARFLALTIANPVTVVYFATVVLGSGIAAGLTAAQGAAFVVGAFLASLSWQTLLASAGGLTGRRLSPAFNRRVSIAGNVVVLGMAAMVVVR